MIIIIVPDKAPSEASFRGKEFLSYDLRQTGGEPIVSAQDSVTFYFKTRQPNGLLFYTGKSSRNEILKESLQPFVFRRDIARFSSSRRRDRLPQRRH